jgi:ribosomal protein S12 methylthiotransferase accessory factor
VVQARRDEIMDRYVDPLTGLVTAVEPDEKAGLPVAKASMRLRETAYAEPGWGRGDSYRGSALTAVLEAVEGWGGVEPGGKRTVVHGCFADLRADAIDPASLGLYPASQFELPDFPFDRYHETVPCRWVWGHSFSVGQPVLVPEAYAYFGVHLRRREPRFVDETSNGCALGSCPEEAILHGLLEVAERDAFLMMWYARMPVPRIHLSTGSLALLTARIEDATGWRISLFHTTLEERVPCVWALAVNPADDPRQAKAACAGGSGLLPAQAIRAALYELGPILASVVRSYPDHADRVRGMVDDPFQVRRMADHSLVYACADVVDRFDFLRTGRQVRTVAEMDAASSPRRSADLRDDLVDLLWRYLGNGLDVVVVDQTTPEHRGVGLACVKVIVPGMLPMTFGHHARRVDGLPRLYGVPYRLATGALR